MTSVNETKFRTKLGEYLKQAITFNDSVNVITNEGNAVIISESDYNSLLETLYLYQFPRTIAEIEEAHDNINNSEYWVSEEEIWDV